MHYPIVVENDNALLIIILKNRLILYITLHMILINSLARSIFPFIFQCKQKILEEEIQCLSCADLT